MSLRCEKCPVNTRAACAVLDAADRDDLAASGRTIALERGEMLFAAGDDNTTCATLVEGALKITRVDAQGNETILALVHPAGFVGEMFTPFARYDVTALTRSRVCLFNRVDIETVVEKHPLLGMALLKRSQEDLHDARVLLDFSRRKSAQARLAAFVLALSRSASDSPCHPAAHFDLPLSRGEIGAMLGLTIETVSRQFGKLEDMGAIRRAGNRGVELLDPECLGKLAA